MAGAEPPPCFACQTCGLHSEGSWRPHAGRAPYPPLPVELMTAFNRGYLSNGCIRQRALYDWVPQFCTLASYDHAATCRLLHGRSILLVGDSTMEQLFAAFVLLLRGRAGRPWMMKDVTASACGDTVRLNFVRMTSRCGSTRAMLRACTSVDAIPPRLQGLTLPAAPRMLTWSSSGLGSIGLQP